MTTLQSPHARRPRGRALLAFALAFGLGAVALAAPAGSLYILDKAPDPQSKTFAKDVQKNSRKSLTKGEDGWHIYFVAYLKKAPNAPEVNLVFYAPGTKDPINHFPIGTSPQAKVMMSDLTLGPDTGIQPGKYDVRVTLLANGKEDVLARTTLELK